LVAFALCIIILLWYKALAGIYYIYDNIRKGKKDKKEEKEKKKKRKKKSPEYMMRSQTRSTITSV